MEKIYDNKTMWLINSIYYFIIFAIGAFYLHHTVCKNELLLFGLFIGIAVCLFVYFHKLENEQKDKNDFWIPATIVKWSLVVIVFIAFCLTPVGKFLLIDPLISNDAKEAVWFIIIFSTIFGIVFRVGGIRSKKITRKELVLKRELKGWFPLYVITKYYIIGVVTSIVLIIIVSSGITLLSYLFGDNYQSLNLFNSMGANLVLIYFIGAIIISRKAQFLRSMATVKNPLIGLMLIAIIFYCISAIRALL